MVAAALALLASLSWGTSDFLAGLESRRSTAWTAALGGQVIASLALICLVVVTAPSQPAPSTLFAPAVGGVVGGLGVVLQYRALALIDMSLVSPIVAGAALVPVVWGTASGERPSAAQALGIALVMLGVLLIAGAKPQATAAPSRSNRKGIALAVCSAVAFGLFLVALDRGGEVDPVSTVAVARTAAALTLLAIAAVARPDIRLTRRAVAPLLVVGFLIVAANLLFATATTFGYLSVVGVLGWLNPAVTMVLAAVVLRERLKPLQLFAAFLVFVGIVFLTVG